MFLSNVLSVASVCGALRFFWSFLLEKYSFKAVYGTLVLFQIIIGFLTPSILHMEQSSTKEAIVSVFICLSFNLEGGHFVLLPTILAKLFGANGGIRLFSVGFSFIGIASFTHIFFISVLLPVIGYSGICYIYACLSAVSLVILFIVFKEERVKLN